MNTTQLESITIAAMNLSERERAKLARDLVASLDGTSEIITEAWDAEICRRINSIECGETELLNVSDAIARTQLANEAGFLVSQFSAAINSYANSCAE